jgi:hypothetical protein
MLTGTVHGGQQPVANTKLYLYAAGAGGYGTASRSMLNSPGYVTTDSGGGFSITSDYVCLPGDQVYLLAVGGNPGLTAGTNNASLTLMAALGACSSLSASTHILVNEVTTVAAAYALAGYMTSATSLASSGSALALTGVKNAFLNAANLASFSGGYALAATPGGNGTVPNAELNTLANILAACVNSTGISSGTGNGQPTVCSALFSAATPPGGSAPADTVQAALNIAHNPGVNVASLFALSSASAPFQPTLSATPADWSVAVVFTGGGIANQGGNGIAIDGNGNIWNLNGASLSLFDPTGTPISPTAGYTAGIAAGDYPFGLAVDSSNNVWYTDSRYTSGTNTTTSKLLKMNSAGVLLSPGNGYTAGGFGSLGDASFLAFDSAGNLWGTGSSTSGSLTTITAAEISPLGAGIAPAKGYTVDSSGNPGLSPSLAGDVHGNMWIGPYEVSPAGSVLVTNSPCGAILEETMAIDHSGNLWNPGNGNMDECNSSGTQIGPTAGYPTSFDGTEGAAVDGDNRIWYFTYNKTQIGVMSATGTPISPTNGYQIEHDLGYGPDYMAIDGSGDVWINIDGPYLVEFVGAASPVVTPLAVATATNTLGVRP